MFVSLQVGCAWSLQRAGDGRRAAASDPVVRRAATPDPERPAVVVCGAGAGADVRRRARRGWGWWSVSGCGSGRVRGCGTSRKPAAAHAVRAERGRRGPSCTTATRGGSLRLGWVAWSPGPPVEATGLWWGVRVRWRSAVSARCYETARRSGRQGRLRHGAGVRARCGAEVQRSRRQGRLLGRLGRPPTWSRHSCGDGFLMMGEKPGGI